VTSTDSPTRPTARPRAGTVVLWVLQLVLAFQFVGAGLLKLIGDQAMVDLFADIGAGQWLRYAVGVLELAGAVGLLIPRLAELAAVGLAGLMIGATLTNLLVIDGSPLLPLAILVVAGVIAWVRRAETATALRR